MGLNSTLKEIYENVWGTPTGGAGRGSNLHRGFSCWGFELPGQISSLNPNRNLICCYAPYTGIKTHNSESRGQEEAGRTRRMSVLFTGSTGVKFVKALNKPPLKLSLSYQGLSMF